MAWECTVKEDQKLANLTVRLIHEDGRLKETEAAMEATMALQIKAMKKLQMGAGTYQERQKRFKHACELKKRTRCHI